LDAATPGPWYAEQEEWPGNENLQYWVGNHADGLGAFVRYEDAYLAAKSIEWLRWQQGEIERLRAELEQVKAERDKYQKALHEEQRESVRLSEILDRIGNICIEHENAKHQPIGTVRMIQKLAAYAEDHTPTERGDSQDER